jgi:hypothetical protein
MRSQDRKVRSVICQSHTAWQSFGHYSQSSTAKSNPTVLNLWYALIHTNTVQKVKVSTCVTKLIVLRTSFGLFRSAVTPGGGNAAAVAILTSTDSLLSLLIQSNEARAQLTIGLSLSMRFELAQQAAHIAPGFTVPIYRNKRGRSNSDTTDDPYLSEVLVGLRRSTYMSRCLNVARCAARST